MVVGDVGEADEVVVLVIVRGSGALEETRFIEGRE